MAEVAASASRSEISTSGGTSTPPNSPKMTVVDSLDDPVSDEEVIYIYRWLDSLEFSKSRKTSCNRDFADGVMMSELIAIYIPKIINSTYCVPSYATSRKIANWEHLNKKVFRRIRFQLTPEIIKDLATARPGMIERVLRKLQPILFLGSKAVSAPSRKLENIKSRFMDFEKSYLKETDKEKATVQENFTPPPRPPQSRPQPKPSDPRVPRPQSKSSKGSSSSGSHAPPPTATPELKVLKTPVPRTSRLPTKKTTTNPPPLQSTSSPPPQSAVISSEPPPNPNDLVHPKGHGENYDIFTRPSTGKSSNDGGPPSPSDLLAEVTNLKTKMDLQDSAQLETDKLIDIIDEVSKKIPDLSVVRSSWLPEEEGDVPENLQAEDSKGNSEAVLGAPAEVLAEEGEYTTSDTDSCSQVSDDKIDDQLIPDKIIEDINNNPSEDTDTTTTGSKLPAEPKAEDPEEEEIDGEVYCDQTGYDEDTEDGGDEDAEGDGPNDGEDSDGDAEADTRPSRDARKKRKLKRVVKYEYREEYVLNGMAAFKLPNSAQLEKLRNDYINKGNKDPNCRGYGFV